MSEEIAGIAGDVVGYTTHAVPRETPDRTVQRPVWHVRVVGTKAVYGLDPGEVGDLELTEGQYASLVAAGHIEDATEEDFTVEQDESGTVSPADEEKDGE